MKNKEDFHKPRRGKRLDVEEWGGQGKVDISGQRSQVRRTPEVGKHRGVAESTHHQSVMARGLGH